MDIGAKDKATLRGLAERYSEIAHSEIQQERIERYRKTNAMEAVRPVVMINEVPWGEIRDEALVDVCVPELSWLETSFRRTLYQWEHFQVDLMVPPVWRVSKRVRSTGIGISVQDKQIRGDTGAYIASHEYVDQLKGIIRSNHFDVADAARPRDEPIGLAFAVAGEEAAQQALARIEKQRKNGEFDQNLARMRLE